MQMNGSAFVSLNICLLNVTGNSNIESIKKIPDKQGEGRRMELRKKERERLERNRDRPSERETAGLGQRWRWRIRTVWKMVTFAGRHPWEMLLVGLASSDVSCLVKPTATARER